MQSAHYSHENKLTKLRNGSRFPYVLGTAPPIYETFIHLLINILGARTTCQTSNEMTGIAHMAT